jgi:indole-3-glycerol phosphate synthase
MFLDKIIQIKREEVNERKRLLPLKALEKMISSIAPPRDFMDAFSKNISMSLIAEIKFASPSLGIIAEGKNLDQIAQQYERGGASAISVLTETFFFKGDLLYLLRVKEASKLPVLQKDFILDPFQIYEGRTRGADAVLLIASLLNREQLKDFVGLTRELDMVPLVEIHDESDLEKTADLSLSLIGINNRNLSTFTIDLKNSLRLKEKIPSTIKVISESGIKDPKDVKLLREAGIQGILVGEILMRSSDPVSKIRELLSI